MAVSETIVQSKRALYVGGLGDDVSQVTLRAAFIPFGPLKTIDIPMDYQKGIHKGFAFVEYEDPEDAAEAMFNMDGAELMGRTLKVSLAQPNQLSLNSQAAVWSTDEWFQQQAGLENKADQEKREATKQDESALTEEQAMS